ncbi:MAG: GNAT family N-acetyltransferase [Betaproteobacteria bacterium]|nr:GNAT family N-acetyltransferase [Betaproteobacteria bacterium]
MLPPATAAYSGSLRLSPTYRIRPWSSVPAEQEISDRHSCLSLKTNKEGVFIPSLVATVETPAFRPEFQPSRRPEGRGFKPKLGHQKNPSMHISTNLAGCVLRSWRPEDKAALLLHANNRNIWRNLTDMFPHPYTETDADQWLSSSLNPSTSIYLAIEVGGEAVGGIGIIAGTGIGQYTGQFGYWLGESLWGRGIATASASALATHALAQPQFVRLEAPVFAWNPASMRVLEKVGFIREGVLRRSVFKDGQLTDSIMYAKVRDA